MGENTLFTVLFICVHNAGRSQMAEAFFNTLSGGRYWAMSAGSRPSEAVNPIVVEAMREVGIDISGNRPKKLDQRMILEADLAITMGCGEDVCPVVPNELRDWDLEDPSGKTIEAVRQIRDEIRTRVDLLIKELDKTPRN
jgi:arsenate reductase (thioredoxin)